MTWVWEHSKARGSELLCLLALADYANDEGEAYPGVKRLAQRCRVNKRAVQKILHKLGEVGEIEVLPNKGISTKTGNTNFYKLSKYIQGVSYSSPLTRQGVSHSSPPGVSHSSPDPSVVTISNKELATQVVAAQPPTASPPTKTTAKHRKSTAYVNPDTGISTNDMFGEYERIVAAAEPGVVLSYGQEMAAAMALVKAGWLPEQMATTFKKLKADGFYTGHLALWTIAKQIAAHHAAAVPLPMQSQLTFSVGNLL